MNQVAMYDALQNALTERTLPRLVGDAFMSGQENATGAYGTDEYKVAAVESIAMADAFLSNAAVREYLETNYGYTY